MEIPYLGKFGPKNQNCHFKLKFGTYTNSNLQNSMVMFILSLFDRKYPFRANLDQKIKLVMFIFFVFYLKYPFWENLFQNFKILTLGWNLVPLLIRACRIQCWCSFFCFWSEIPFFGKFAPKSQNYQLKLKFASWTNSNMQNSMMLFSFLVFEWK